MIKKYLLAIVVLFSTINITIAQAKKKQKVTKVKTTEIVEVTKAKTTDIAETKTTTNSAIQKKITNKIDWLTWEEAQKRMAVTPKKVYVDVFTDWCGWCKVMDQKTFTNTNVIKYLNENFYCIKFNSEKDNNIVFNGKVYAIEGGTSKLASELLKGKMMYPTSIVFEENFTNPQPIPGYLDIKDIQPILTYLGGNHYRTTSYDDYKKGLPITW